MADLGVIGTRLWLTLMSWEPVHDLVQNYQHCSLPQPLHVPITIYTSTHSEVDVVNTVHMNTWTQPVPGQSHLIPKPLQTHSHAAPT